MNMDPTSDHLDDETLSALLDGAAEDAAAHLPGCERCSGRQAELAAARAALQAAPVESLDELTRRRLVTTALEAAGAAPPAGRARVRRHPALVGSAAAVILAVLVGVPFVLGNDRSSRDHTALSAQAPESAQDAAAFLGDLGDLSDRDRLRLRLSGASPDAFTAAPAEPAASPPAAGRTAEPLATTTAPLAAAGSSAGAEAGAAKSAPTNAVAADQPYASDQSALTDRDRADTDACVAALLNGAARGGRLTRSGTGTYQGRPSIAAAFELSGGTVAFIVDRSGCGVLDRFAL
jgi:hypothetical protein